MQVGNKADWIQGGPDLEEGVNDNVLSAGHGNVQRGAMIPLLLCVHAQVCSGVVVHVAREVASRHESLSQDVQLDVVFVGELLQGIEASHIPPGWCERRLHYGRNGKPSPTWR